MAMYPGKHDNAIEQRIIMGVGITAQLPVFSPGFFILRHRHYTRIPFLKGPAAKCGWDLLASGKRNDRIFI
jgi:hypothetical protein